MITELEHRIRERAHMIWEREGRPADRAEAHWMTASAEIAAEAAPAAKPKPRRKVAAAKIHESKIGSASVEACFIKVIDDWTFPKLKAGERVQVRQDFELVR